MLDRSFQEAVLIRQGRMEHAHRIQGRFPCIHWRSEDAPDCLNRMEGFLKIRARIFLFWDQRSDVAWNQHLRRPTRRLPESHISPLATRSVFPIRSPGCSVAIGDLTVARLCDELFLSFGVRARPRL